MIQSHQPVSPLFIAPTVSDQPGAGEDSTEGSAIGFEDAVLDDPIYGPDLSKDTATGVRGSHRSKVLPAP